MSRAVGYCRISDKDQSANSLPDQEIQIREYCQRNGLTLDKVFIENGRSAFTFDRKEWKKLEIYLKENKGVKFIIVKHIDRFSRATLLDALLKINEIEKKLNRKILAVSDKVDVDTSDLGFQMMRTIELIMSNNERNQIVKRVKDGIYRSYANGRFCNKAPFGYRNSRDETDRPLIIPEPSEAKLVQQVFKLYLSGMNIADIARKVKVKQKGNSAITRILSNPVYAGIIQVPPYSGRPGYEVDGIHKPIISKSEYYKAIARLSGKKAVQQPKDDVWLRGVISCPCGRKMTAGNSKGRKKYYWYYKCPECLINYRADKLQTQFVEILKLLCLSESTVEFIKSKIKESIDAQQKNRGGNIMQLNLQLDKIRAKLKDVQGKYLLSQDIPVDVFRGVVNGLKAQEADILDQLDRTNFEAAKLKQIFNEVLPLLTSIDRAFELFPLHQKHLFVRTIFENSLVYDGQLYRTAGINKVFIDKQLILKEKRLLIIDNNLPILEAFPLSTQNGSIIEPFYELYRVLVG